MNKAKINKLMQLSANVILHISLTIHHYCMYKQGKWSSLCRQPHHSLSFGIDFTSISKHCRDLPVFNNIDHWRTPSNSELLEKYGYHISLWVRDIIKDELLFFNTSK